MGLAKRHRGGEPRIRLLRRNPHAPPPKPSNTCATHDRVCETVHQDLTVTPDGSTLDGKRAT
jgi:hypothetical protein